MSVRSTQEVTLISAPAVSHVRSTQEVLLISIPISSSLGVTYPISPPAISGIGPADITMQMVTVNGKTVSPFTLNQQIQNWPGQQFRIEANLPPLPLADGEQWVAFLGQLFGIYGTFLMGDYARPTPQGPMSGSPVVNGTNANGLNQLNIRGAAASIANWAVAGDYIQVTSSGGPQRLYKVLQNASTNGSGDATLEIFPSLRESLTDGIAIVTANCQGTFRLQANTAEWKVKPGPVYTISFKAEEAI